MKIVLALAVAALLAAPPALAQTAPERTYTLTVTASDLGTIAKGLGEVVAKEANPVINRLNQQIAVQDTPAKPAEDKPKP